MPVSTNTMSVGHFINASDTLDRPSEPCCNERVQCVVCRAPLFACWFPAVVAGGATCCIVDYLIMILSCCNYGTCDATRSFCSCMCNPYCQSDDCWNRGCCPDP